MAMHSVFMVTSQSRVDWDRVHMMVLSDFSLWGTYSGGPIRCETDCCKDRRPVKTGWNHAQSEGVEGFLVFFFFKCHNTVIHWLIASRPNSTGLVEQA